MTRHYKYAKETAEFEPSRKKIHQTIFILRFKEIVVMTFLTQEEKV